MAIALADGEVLAVAEDGRRTRALGRVPTWGAVDAVDVSPDGRQVLVSVLDETNEGGPPDSSGAPTNACRAAVYRLAPGRPAQRLVSGAAASIAPDGLRVAYLGYGLENGYCVRRRLVVRDLAGGLESTVPLPGGSTLDGTPPGWPLNWSPDSRRLTFVSGRGAVVTDPDGRHTTAVGGGRPAGSDPLPAPVFLADGTLAAMTGCCLGGQGRMVAQPATGGPSVLFALDTPVRSIRPDRGGTGLWLTSEETGLWHWDGHRLRRVYGPALITSG